MKTKPGEVYLVDLGLAAKARMVLLVSVEDDNAPFSDLDRPFVDASVSPVQVPRSHCQSCPGCESIVS